MDGEQYERVMYKAVAYLITAEGVCFFTTTLFQSMTLGYLKIHAFHCFC